MRNSVEFKKNSYARRTTGILILPLWFCFMLIIRAVKQHIDISDYTLYLFAFMTAMIIAVLAGGHLAEKKFNNKSGE